jgi:hypothetical protein
MGTMSYGPMKTLNSSLISETLVFITILKKTFLMKF